MKFTSLSILAICATLIGSGDAEIVQLRGSNHHKQALKYGSGLKKPAGKLEDIVSFESQPLPKKHAFKAEKKVTLFDW